MNITNIVDVIIVLIIALWGISGLKRGVVKQGVITLGTIIMFILAFYLKNPIAEFLSLHLPFFKFGGLLGAEAFNILLYQTLAFIIVVSILEIILHILIKLSGFVEFVLKATIIFGIPSKILGFILGVIEGVVIVYIALFFISQPAFNFNLLKDSTLTPVILNKVPGLSNIASGVVETFTDISDLTDKYYASNNSSQYTKEVIDTMLKHNVIKADYVDKLIEKGKIKTELTSVLNKYR